MADGASLKTVDQLWGSLHAEYEAEWLPSVYVPPARFSTFVQPYPCIVFGDSGSGKSALRLMLTNHAERDLQARPLVVPWKPAPPRRPIETPVVEWYLHQGLHTCALTLLHHIAQQPSEFEAAAGWAQTLIADFLQLYFQGNWSYQGERLLSESDPAAQPVIQQLMNHKPVVDREGVDELHIMAELVAALRFLGLSGVWVIGDGLDSRQILSTQQIEEQFQSFLSTLALFEEPGFIFKFMAPLSLRPVLLASGGILRRRLEPYTLTWTPKELVRMLHLRFAPLGLPLPPFLKNLSADEAARGMGQEEEGLTPGRWLQVFAPLVRDYVADPDAAPKEVANEWIARIPALRIDRATEQVFIGQRPLEALTPSSYKLLCYLYDQHPRICTRAELYYRLYKNLDYVPRSSADTGWDNPATWRSTIDTALSRLRDLFEPDDASHYLITFRGKGVRLDNIE